MKKQFLLLVFFSLFSLCGYAQVGEAGNWGGGVDHEILHFGFTFQYISSEYKIYKKPSWQSRYPATQDAPIPLFTDSLKSISSPVAPGFGLGFVTNLRLGPNADLRFTPALVFVDRLLEYRYPDETVVPKQVKSTVVDFPLGIKLKSDRRRNFRAYLLAGGKYSMDIISKKKFDDTDKILTEKFVKNNKNILSYEVGIGFDFYFEYFKLSPELKLSNSINSVLTPEDHPFSSPLEKLYTRNFQFSLYFE
ncbi:MAG: outer membrane beta-barrel protein [Pyrinomonadaceae bacterium]|nr:outer membrane beta-barrel protein [Sphingobacteriaceae bacterium]